MFAPPTAADVLVTAEGQARNSGRNVMLIYHASWCGWCHKLDDALSSAELSPLINKAYVVVHVDVLESPDKKSLENDGGADDKTGIPFFVFLNPDGKVLGTSIPKGKTNIGYPGEPDEIAYFMQLVQASAPTLSSQEQSKIETYFRVAATKLSGHG